MFKIMEKKLYKVTGYSSIEITRYVFAINLSEAIKKYMDKYSGGYKIEATLITKEWID